MYVINFKLFLGIIPQEWLKGVDIIDTCLFEMWSVQIAAIKHFVVCNIWTVDTLYNVILRIAVNFLETREKVKISTHPFYYTNLDWFSWEWSKKKIEKRPFWKIGHFEIFSLNFFFFCCILMKISPNLYGRMDGSKFWLFLWFPGNFLLCVI